MFMEKEFNIIKNLTGPQRLEFDRDMQQLFLQCHKTLKVICEYDNMSTNKVKGKITELHKYNNEKEYNQALAIERASLN